MKFWLSILALVLAFAPVRAQGQGNDPEAKKILDAVSRKFKSFNGVEASFTMWVEDAVGKVLGRRKGKVYMKGSKYKVSITGQEIFCDGKNVWTYDQEANEVTITELDPSGSNITPQKLFTSFYDKDFLYKLNGEKNQGGRILQEIEMTPVDKSRAFHKVYVLVDKLNKTIALTRVLEKNGNKYSYEVESLNGQASLNDELFVFNQKKYPGVEEVDLR